MKMWNYVFIAVGLSLLFEFAGLTGGSGILSAIGFTHSSGVFAWDLQSSTLWTGIFTTAGILSLAALGGAIWVGIATKSPIENLILIPFITGTLVIFVQAYVNVVKYSIDTFPGWTTALLILIIGPFIPLFVVSAVEFFRGTD